MRTTKEANPQPRSPKKAYRTPVLSLFGDVRHLTGGSGGTKQDASTGRKTRACWIAEVLYGEDAPRVVLVRDWLSRSCDGGKAWAQAVVPLYERFGERIAESIRVFPPLGRLFRPLFDAAVRKACRAGFERAAGAGTAREVSTR